ncbi:MAG: hypothetical protein FWG90_10140 [Oscillospiraceae bacterium]|nr:hypothetical protein [Oscillospiraceae bacterium]
MFDISSKEYAQKFSGVTSSAKGDKLVAEYARQAILDNAGHNTEDAYFLNAKNGKLISHQKLGEYGGKLEMPLVGVKLIVLHNHPNSTSFSFKDFVTVNNNSEIAMMIAVGHDGTVYSLSVGNGTRIDLSDESDYNFFDRQWGCLCRDYGSGRGALEKIIDKMGWDFYVK